MNSVKTAFTNQFSLMSQFDDVCHKLRADDNLDCLQKPISYWARQGDRGLPYALLRLTVREVIDTPLARASQRSRRPPSAINSTCSRRGPRDNQGSLIVGSYVGSLESQSNQSLGVDWLFSRRMLAADELPSAVAAWPVIL